LSISAEPIETTVDVVVRARAVTKVYGDGDGRVQALNGINLDIRRGQMTAIMGPSGSGKSTLMHVLAGLDGATSGSVVFDGTEITGLDDDARTLLRRRQIGFVFQAFNLVPTLDVMGNILLPFELDGTKPTAERLSFIERLLTDLGLQSLRRRRPYELSGGQQQRVAILRALAMKPTIIFADEPTGALDSRTGREVLDLLTQATSEYQQSVILVTHDPVAASYADRVVFIADGDIAHDVPQSDAQTLSSLILGFETKA
jgi:putative ABC transport system ATP-binding protein